LSKYLNYEDAVIFFMREGFVLNNLKPLVSIITPVFNASRFIKDCITSVKEQTYENWELILVDDCSKDDSVHIINEESADDGRIILVQLDKNGGAAAARNKALDMAKGEYVAFLDSDDIWLPEKLENQVHFMVSNNISFSFTEYGFIDESGNELNKHIKVPTEVDYNFLLKNTIIGCLTVMLDKRAFGNIQMSSLMHEDYALWLSLLRDGCKAYGLQKKLALYRVVKGSLSSNKLKAAKGTWRIYRLEKLGFLKACWCFLNYSINAIKKRL